MDFAPKTSRHEDPGPAASPPALDLGANGSDHGPPASSAEQVPNGAGAANLASTELPSPATGPQNSGGAPDLAVPLWLLRVWVVIRVAFFVELGMVLVVLPWTRLWTENSLLAAYPSLRLFLQQNFVRGVISGLGLIDLGLGVWEAVRYKEPPPR